MSIIRQDCGCYSYVPTEPCTGIVDIKGCPQYRDLPRETKRCQLRGLEPTRWIKLYGLDAEIERLEFERRGIVDVHLQTQNQYTFACNKYNDTLHKYENLLKQAKDVKAEKLEAERRYALREMQLEQNLQARADARQHFMQKLQQQIAND
jgi:hypothetical protein